MALTTDQKRKQEEAARRLEAEKAKAAAAEAQAKQVAKLKEIEAEENAAKEKAEVEKKEYASNFVAFKQATPREIHNVNRGLTPDGKKRK